MRLIFLSIFIVLISCNTHEGPGTTAKTDTLRTRPLKTPVEQDTKPKDTLLHAKVYANDRFKDVVVERIGNDSFLIQGRGQIFEASFNWVLEDGHEELKKGYAMTDAGAPEWGKFKFTFHAQKKRANSTITLILFESSAMDGSRQHELPIVLY